MEHECRQRGQLLHDRRGVNLRTTATPTDVTVSYNGNGTLTLSLLQGSSGTSYSMSVPLGSIFASSAAAPTSASPAATAGPPPAR